MQGCYKKWLPTKECPSELCEAAVNRQQMPNVQSKADLHERTQSLWNIQAEKAKGEQCIPIFINNCVKYVLSTIVFRLVLRLAVYGPILLPDHRVGPH